uniref:AB hydrolase-1 domain-containing protein n=1 Tax=Arion vulgaris TaxID=1028688 RepID=A0A0B6Z614_9EUPU
MRPSGLHVNKPVIIGLIAAVIIIFLGYRHLTRSVMAPKSVELSVDNVEDVPELTDAIVKELKRESMEIDIKVVDTTVKIYVEQVIKDRSSKLDVLFLHGASLTSQDWLKIKSTDHVANWGYRSVAIDMPGKGKSPNQLSLQLARKFLDAFIRKMEMKNVVIIAPSASGQYALPYLFNDVNNSNDFVVGFIPIAPVATPDFKEQYPNSQVKTLIVYGSKDAAQAVFLENLQLIPNHKVVKIEDTGHGCYLENPDAFHTALFHFLKELVP